MKQRLARIVRAFTAGDRWVAGLALATIAYYCATPGVFQGKASGDGYFGFMYLPSLFYHHTLDIAPTVPVYAKYLGVERTGHVANPCPIGTVAFWTPLYLLARALEWIAARFVQLPRESLPGQTVFDFWVVGLGSLAAGLAGVATTFRLIARRLSVGAARFAVVTMVAATPLAWYFTIQPMYQHACAFFMVAVLVERWDAWRGAMTPRRWAWLGLLGGAAMLMRVQEAIFLLLPGLDALEGTLRRRGKDFTGGLIFTGCAFIAFLPQLLIWYWYFAAIRTPQPPHHMRWADPGLVATVFSTRAGLLPWAPILYLVIPGLILARKRLGGFGWRIGLMLALDLWVNASAWDHWASWAYGARRFTDASTAFAVGLGGMWAWAEARPKRYWRNGLIAFAAFTIAFNGLMMELVRRGKVKSSASHAFAASTWVKWANGPQWLGKIFDTIGYPFCQPAGWIHAAIYRVPPRNFEALVGNYLLERDCRVHAVVNVPGFDFDDALTGYVVDGVTGPPVDHLVPVGTRVRMLLPLFVREPLRARITGDFRGRERDVTVTWNGVPLAVDGARGTVSFEIPPDVIHTRARENEVFLAVPEGTRLKRLDLQSLSVWW